MLFLAAMTLQEATPLISGARLVGIIGVASFWQELYGTVIYFLSFIFNGRYKHLTTAEVVIFVLFTNGLWFFLPLLGIKCSVDMIYSDSYSSFL